jgi:hypothetical protein
LLPNTKRTIAAGYRREHIGRSKPGAHDALLSRNMIVDILGEMIGARA